MINDINVFKSYRDDVDINVRKENDFYQFLTIAIAIISILASNFKVDNIDKIIKDRLIYDLIIKVLFIKDIFIALIPFALAGYAYFMFTNVSHSESNKLKVINNVIYTLEAIKEDMDKNGDSGMESNEIISTVNEKSDDGNTEDITTEDANERFEGLKLTEVIEVRTYKAKATKNKYSPRAMYERKRR